MRVSAAWTFAEKRRGPRYHRRSMIESTFSMVKRVLGDSVRAKSDVAMKNEVLAKFVCHNIRCVIAGIYERGIDPTFLGLPTVKACTQTDPDAQKPLVF